MTLAVPYATPADPCEIMVQVDIPFPKPGENHGILPEWKCGDTILDTCTVEEIYEWGGFGRVYRVHRGAETWTLPSSHCTGTLLLWCNARMTDAMAVRDLQGVCESPTRMT